MLNQTVTKEATAICKGMEMTHGNSLHYLTFELDSGERVYFQVSIKCYMMIVEGDRCLITYKDSRSSSKKKLKSFEIIAKTVPVSAPVPTPVATKIAEPVFVPTPVQEIETIFDQNQVEFNEIEPIEEYVPKKLNQQKKPNQGSQSRGNQNRSSQNRNNQNRNNQNRNNQNRGNQKKR